MVNERLIFKDRKGEALIRSWVIGILLFSGIFALLFLASSDLLTEYDKTTLIDEGYSDNYNRFSDASEDFRDLSVDMKNEESGVLEIIFGDAGVLKAFYNVLKITFESISILDDLATDFIADFGVPKGIANIIVPLLSMILIIFLIFAFISSINRGSKI